MLTGLFITVRHAKQKLFSCTFFAILHNTTEVCVLLESFVKSKDVEIHEVACISATHQVNLFLAIRGKYAYWWCTW